MAKNENLRASSPKIFADGLTASSKKKSVTKPSGPSLGPLAQLPGTWVGQGFNLVSLPVFNVDAKFRVQLNTIKETLTFTDDVGPIPNRGNTQPDIIYAGLRYLQQVDDAITHEGLHIEPGLWAFLPANVVQTQPSVVRMGSVPHGDSLLAQGRFLTFDGAPQIGEADATPFTLNPDGSRKNDTSETYLQPFADAAKEMGVDLKDVMDPNRFLIRDNEALAKNGRKIVQTVVLFVDAKPVGGINGTPVSPEPENVGGITNIPFVVKNADANSMSAIFWINTVQNPDGTQFLQLQYTQTVILDFPVPGPDGRMVDIKWPHITVATLTRR